MSVIDEILIRTFEQSPEILTGLKSGLYQIWGGVIRVTAGNDGAGSIVAHLKFPHDASQAQQRLTELQNLLSANGATLENGIGALQGSMDALQNLQYANLALSGLNLAGSTVGFIIVCQKLNRIEQTLHQQSRQLDALLNIANSSQQREHFRNEARFIAIIESARQFAESDDQEPLKQLIPAFIEQYEYTRQILEQAASNAATPKFIASLPELSVLQERLLHLGISLSYIQQKLQRPHYAVEALHNLQLHWRSVNETIINNYDKDREAICRMSQHGMDGLMGFLRERKTRQEGLAYQEAILNLACEHSALLEILNDDSDEILLLTH